MLLKYFTIDREIEGEMTNDFKVGKMEILRSEWCVTKTKIQTINDSADVQFPQFIFNESETCDEDFLNIIKFYYSRGWRSGNGQFHSQSS